MGALAKILSLLTIPLILLNFFGGIISGIWLAILGEWSLIGYGILAIIVGGFLIGLALLPSMVLVMPAVALMQKGHNILGYIFGFLGTVYTIGVVSAWCIFILIAYVNQANSDSIIPILIWSYGVANSPMRPGPE